MTYNIPRAGNEMRTYANPHAGARNDDVNAVTILVGTMTGTAELVANDMRDAIVASGREAALIRQAVGAGFSIVCPGIRPDGGGSDDQKRSVGVAEAFAAGADAIVVGRPVRNAADPVAAATLIQQQIAASLR